LNLQQGHSKRSGSGSKVVTGRFSAATAGQQPKQVDSRNPCLL
jgi:hypothetical protein